MDKSYGALQALSDINLDVHSGQIVALLGPNGAGKTTLVSIISALRKPDRGDVWVDGIDVGAHPRSARQRLGLAPQETGIYPSLSVRDNLGFFGELAGLRRQRLRKRITEVTETFALTGLLDRKGSTLSGGEARRLHTAMVVLHSPPLLLLDEPTAGVDIQTRNSLLELVRSLANEGSAVLYSTHYLQEVEQLDASSVAILANGKLIASGSTSNLIRTLGDAMIELRFNGPAPWPNLPEGAVSVDSDIVRVPVAGPPTVAAASLLQSLDGAGSDLREIKLIQPSLESAFLAITSGIPSEGEVSP
ncbi:MAG: ABC transporter ATP-binding protein [Solirubrobacterales bacterium]